MIEGGCYCGLLRYCAEGALSHETHCHCSICRRTTGAACVAWFTVERRNFAFTAGTPTRFASSEHGTRSFCPKCGTQLSFESSSHPDEVDVTIGSLDDPEQLSPRDHTRTSSQLSWLRFADGLPRFAEARE